MCKEFPDMKNADVSTVLASRWKVASDSEKQPHIDKERVSRQKYYQEREALKAIEMRQLQEERALWSVSATVSDGVVSTPASVPLSNGAIVVGGETATCSQPMFVSCKRPSQAQQSLNCAVPSKPCLPPHSPSCSSSGAEYTGSGCDSDSEESEAEEIGSFQNVLSAFLSSEGVL